jgi:energy-coupling factor transporter ATP-binding protein EcfA2
MADVGVTVGGSVPGVLVVGDHNVVIQADHSSVTPREDPPPQPRLRRRPGGLPLPRGGPEPIGRDAELRQIEGWFDEGSPVEVIGPPGIGKSLLLRTLAGQRSRAGNEVVYLAAAGLSVEDIVQGLFQACYDSEDYKPDPARLRRLMGSVRALVIVDDLAATPEEITVLLDAVPSSSLVISSAQRCLWGEGHLVELAGLDAGPALALVERELDRRLDESERSFFEAFRQEVAGHPLAMIQAARAVRAAKEQSLLPDRQALAGALASGLGEQAHSVLSLLLAVEPIAVPAELIEALTDAAGELTRLEQAGLIQPQPEGYHPSPPMAGLVVQSADVRPDPAVYVQPLASWAADATPQQIADTAPLIVTILSAAVAQHAYVPAKELARTAAPALCRTLRWGAWQRVLALGKQAAHALDAKEDEAYFAQEEQSRLKALGKGMAIGAAIGAAFVVGQHIGQAAAAKGATAGLKGCLSSPIAITAASAVAVAGLIGTVSYVNRGDPTTASPSYSSAPPLIPSAGPGATSPVPADTPSPPAQQPAPQPTTDLAGNYTLTRILISCHGFETCHKEPMPLRIDCTSGSCTIVGDGLERHSLSFDGNTATTTGPDGLFNYCGTAKRPGSIALTLAVTSWRTGRDSIRRPNELSGRLTSSSPAYGSCPAGDAVWDVSLTPGSAAPPDTGPSTGVISPAPGNNPANPPNASPCQNAPSRGTCDQQSPTASGCDQDGTVVSGGQATGPLHGIEFTVELLWSPTCQTNWSRARPTGNQSAQFGPWIEPERGDATRFFATVRARRDWVNSPMAYSDGGTAGAAACVIVPGSQQPYFLCTPMLMHNGRHA